MKYKLRRYNISIDLRKIDLGRLRLVWMIIAVLTTLLMVISLPFAINNNATPIFRFIIMTGCFTVLGFGLLDYKAQIKQRIRYPEFHRNNYFWIFNTIVWTVLFLTSI